MFQVRELIEVPDIFNGINYPSLVIELFTLYPNKTKITISGIISHVLLCAVFFNLRKFRTTPMTLVSNIVNRIIIRNSMILYVKWIY